MTDAYKQAADLYAEPVGAIPPHWNSIVNAQKAWESGDKARAIKIIANINFKRKLSKADHKAFVVASDFNSGLGERFWAQMGWSKEEANRQAEELFIKHFLDQPKK